MIRTEISLALQLIVIDPSFNAHNFFNRDLKANPAFGESLIRLPYEGEESCSHLLAFLLKNKKTKTPVKTDQDSVCGVNHQGELRSNLLFICFILY